MDDLTGKTIGSYTLRECIGRGGFGAVYNAYQSVINREVAIKVILPVYANHPDFIRSFEVEAQLIARLEHPHIVPLYDYWREPDSAYLVMRLLRDNLRSALVMRTWDISEVVTLVDQIASALMIAHRHGVVHLDIKPDNILLDEDNNAYLSDFGIARDLIGQRDAAEKDTMVGSPEYMAPEQVLRAAITPQTDIYSLGIVLYQILTGEKPFSDPSVTAILYSQVNEPIPPLQSIRPDLPRALNSIIWRATAKNPGSRYPDVSSLAVDLRQAATSINQVIDPSSPLDRTRTSRHDSATLQVQEASTRIIKPTARAVQAEEGQTRIFGDLAQPLNPFKGLRAFEEADALDFFGREKITQRLLQQLQNRLSENDDWARFLAVVGPSGSGKSSLVKAGLVPALRHGGLPGSEKWFLTSMVPGSHPFDELKSALLRIASDAASFVFDQPAPTDDGHLGLLDTVHQILPDDDSQLILVIDQFEEVFTLVEDEAERSRFLNSLLAATTARSGRFWTIITMRADFYDRPLLYSGFGDLMRRHTEVLLPLLPEELEDAITGPAERAGLAVEPDLVKVIVADVNEQPGALPLLQYALTELFERRKGFALTLDAYRESGGVLGALARRAEERYQKLPPDQQETARQLFLRLISLGEGVEVTRRRALMTELISISENSAQTQDVLNTFSQYRLLTFDRDPVTRTPAVQLAHEALIREWQRLKDWIENSREELLVQRRLTAATIEWLNTDRDPSFLATGARLTQFEDLSAQKGIALNEDETAYVRASIALRQRAANRLRMFIAALIVFSVVSLALAAFAIDRQNQAIVERDRADLQGRIARSRELSVTALVNANQPDLGLLLSLEAHDTADTFEARNSLLTSLQSNPSLLSLLHGHTDLVRSVAFRPDGQVLASGSRGVIILWDMVTRRPLTDLLEGHDHWINSVTFSPDSKTLASASADNTIRLWDAQTGQSIEPALAGHDDAVWSAAFSPDGKTLASGSADNTIRLWDTADHAQIGEPLTGHEDIVFSLAFSPDGQTIASASADGTVRLWDTADHTQIGEPFDDHENWVLSVTFSPDGAILASSDADSVIILRDSATGQILSQFPSGQTDWVRNLAFSPDGTILASSSADGTIRLWDVMTGGLVGQPLIGHAGAIWSSAFSPDGQTIAAASADHDIILWDVPQRPALSLDVMQYEQAVLSVAFSPDSTLLAAAGGDITSAADEHTIQVWDVETLVNFPLEGHLGPVTSVAFSPDGRMLASASADQTVKLWDIITRRVNGEPLIGHDNVVWSVAFSPDGQTIASAGDDAAIILWDALTHQAIGQPLTGHTDGVLRVVFSPDGTRLASAGRDNTIRLWDIESHQAVGQPLTGHTDYVTSIAFSPDGQTIASASRDMTIRLWDAARYQAIGQPLTGHTDYVTSIAFSPDGRTLASASDDTTVILWDIATAQPLGSPFTGHRDWVNSIAFSPDGHLLASGSSDTTIMLWDVSIDSWRASACRIANRDLTENEWATYFQDIPYHPTCIWLTAPG